MVFIYPYNTSNAVQFGQVDIHFQLQPSHINPDWYCLANSTSTMMNMGGMVRSTQRIEVSWLARALTGWSGGSGALHRQLSDALRSLIELGEIPAGARLPSERQLAGALSVSRTTVISAYEALKAEAQLESRQGSGTRVRSNSLNGLSERDSGLIGAGRLRGYYTPVAATIDLSTAAMPGLPLSAEIATSLNYDEVLQLTEEHGYYSRGLPELRHKLAEYFCQAGVPTTMDEILVTSGAQQALEVVASSLLIPGDEVIIEDPTYRGAIQAFQALGARMLTVPSGENGIDIDVLRKRIGESACEAIYVLPTVQNPTGSVLSDARRKTLVDLALKHGITVIDDASPADLLYSSDAPPPLASFAPDTPIVTIGSCSKLFWGGLRVGWVRAPANIISRLARVKQGITDLGTSVLSQKILCELLPHADEARVLRQQQLATGLECVGGLLTELLPTWQWKKPAGGAALWVQIPHGSSTTFSQVALQHGVSVVPGPIFSIEGNFEDIVRIPFGLPPQTLRTGITRLSLAWEEHLSRGMPYGIDSRPIA